MIIQLQKYISKTLLLTTIPIIFLVLGVDFLFALIHELGGVGKGGFTTWNALVYVLMTLPRRLYELFPMTSLVGVLLGLGLLASHSELIVMRASGISIARITAIVFQFGLFLALLMGAIGEFVAPKTEYWAEAYKIQAQSSGQAVLTIKGTWVRKDNHFIHIKVLQGDGRLQGVTDYEFDDKLALVAVSSIKEAVYQEGQWTLHEVTATVVNATPAVVTHTEKTTRTDWINPNVLNITLAEPEDLSMRGLYQYAQYLQDNNLDNKTYLLNFWKKAMQPLAVMVMIMLSVPFIFGPLRSASMGLRLLAGILIGFSFYVLSEIFGPLAMVYYLPPFFAALLPIMIFGLIGFYLSQRKIF